MNLGTTFRYAVLMTAALLLLACSHTVEKSVTTRGDEPVFITEPVENVSPGTIAREFFERKMAELRSAGPADRVCLCSSAEMIGQDDAGNSRAEAEYKFLLEGGRGPGGILTVHVAESEHGWIVVDESVTPAAELPAALSTLCPDRDCDRIEGSGAKATAWWRASAVQHLTLARHWRPAGISMMSSQIPLIGKERTTHSEHFDIEGAPVPIQVTVVAESVDGRAGVTGWFLNANTADPHPLPTASGEASRER